MAGNFSEIVDSYLWTWLKNDDGWCLFSGGGGKFIVWVLLEYIRSLTDYHIPVQHYLHELVINSLVQHKAYYQLHQLLQYHVVSDSKPLVSMYQINTDMRKFNIAFFLVNSFVFFKNLIALKFIHFINMVMTLSFKVSYILASQLTE